MPVSTPTCGTPRAAFLDVPPPGLDLGAPCGETLPPPVFEGSEKRLELRFEVDPVADAVGADDDAQAVARDAAGAPCGPSPSLLPGGLRSLTRASIDAVLSDAACQVVSARRHALFDAYVLSESSLFVYEDRAVLKTCGTTLLLRAVPRLVREAARPPLGPPLRPAAARYSRASYLFPDQQPAPHTGFAQECEALVESLPDLDDRAAHVMGDELDGEGLRWHVFEASRGRAKREKEEREAGANGQLSRPASALGSSSALAPRASRSGSVSPSSSASSASLSSSAWSRLMLPLPPVRTIEVCCTGLDPRRARRFSAGAAAAADPAAAAVECARVSGVDRLVPGAPIDGYAFDPCGYSMNAAVAGDSFATVHVTPEEHCSYASFEASGDERSAPVLGCAAELVARVAAVFAPERMVVASSVSGGVGGAWGAPPPPPAGYDYASASAVALQHGGHVLFCSLVRREDADAIQDLGVGEDVALPENAGENAQGDAAAKGLPSELSLLAELEAAREGSASPAGSDRDAARAKELLAARGAVVTPTPDREAILGHRAGGDDAKAPPAPASSAASSPPRVPTPCVPESPRHLSISPAPQEAPLPASHAAPSAQEAPLPASHASLPVPGAPLHSRSAKEVKAAFGALPIAAGAAGLDAAARAHARAHALEDTFWLVDLGAVERRAAEWRRAFPRVRAHYAVKALPDPAVLALLASLGCGFDCASAEEIQAARSAGVQAKDVVLANACKRPADLRAARLSGVELTTFDSLAELDKCAVAHPGAKLLLRIRADAREARCPLGSKYGAEHDEWPALLDRAAELGLDVAGVAFHVGSGASEDGAPDAFREALASARLAWDEARARGFAPHVLDIGGGFPGGDLPAAIPEAINEALERHFGAELDAAARGKGVDEEETGTRGPAAAPAAPLRFPSRPFAAIAEPGRFFAERAAAVVTSVFGVRDRAGVRELWVSDGLYGAMNSILYDHASPLPRPLPLDPRAARPEARCTIFGPTCDGLDTILTDHPFAKLEVGDWVAWHDMGAYTLCGACKFNGIDAVDVPRFYVASGERQKAT